MRHLLHKAICWYLRRAGGAFHCYNYGATGRYVALMNERQYHRYMALAQDQSTGERILTQERLVRNICSNE